MFVDIVHWPKNLEKEFLALLNQLNQRIVCLADENIKKPLYEEPDGIKIIHLPFNSRVNGLGILELKDVENLRDFLSHLNRKIIFGFESLPLKESVSSFPSGLNRAICKEMNKRENIYGLCISQLIHSPNKTKMLSKAIQNLFLCNKYSVKVAVFTLASSPYDLRSEKEVRALLNTLSSNQRFARDAMKTIPKLIDVESFKY
ncbi:MAG: hypothetical protein PWQ87_727 [Candidatus Woesearchaeota archaeon]|nr:hypothetical protein [Candidatus Woesearchaeota archaeon]